MWTTVYLGFPISLSFLLTAQFHSFYKQCWESAVAIELGAVNSEFNKRDVVDALLGLIV